MSSPCLGIDFGTCSTSAALLLGEEIRQVDLSQSRYGDPSDMPTAVFVEPDGTFLVGHQAARARLRDAGRYIDRFKLEMERSPGRTLFVAGAARTIGWTEIVTAVLAHVKAQAEKDLNSGAALKRAVLTVPALYVEGGVAWKTMQDAAKNAGFEEISIVREPHAAALYYDHLLRKASQGAGADGELVLVYDLGGGTFDPALIRRSGDRYPLERAQGSGVRCGGIFFDEALRKDFLSKRPEVARELTPPSRNEDGAVPDSERGRARAFARAVGELEKFLLDCKHGFSQPGVTVFDEPAPPLLEEDYRITRREFDTLLSALLDSTIDCCEGLLRSAGCEWKELSRVILVGGSCSLPIVRDKIASAMERAGADASRICWQRIAGTDIVIDPRFAVGRGACCLMLKSLAPTAVSEKLRSPTGAGEDSAGGREPGQNRGDPADLIRGLDDLLNATARPANRDPPPRPSAGKAASGSTASILEGLDSLLNSGKGTR